MNDTVGVIEGGWGFVIAAYTVVWGGMFLYGVSLALRRRRAAADAAAVTPGR